MKNRKIDSESPVTPEGLKPTTFTTVNKKVDVITVDDKLFTMQEVGKRVTYIKDTLEYVKVYKNSFHVLRTLSSSGLQVLFYVLEHIEPKSNNIYLYPQEILDWTGYKNIKSVYQGIKELIDKEILFQDEKRKNYFYININYFYNGKRI